MEWVLNEYRYVDNTSYSIYKKKASDSFRHTIEQNPGRQYVFMDVLINGSVQKIVFELFTEYAPQTCENFRKLCSGSFVNKKGEKLSYIGTEFHRVVKGMYIQAGDMSKHGISK